LTIEGNATYSTGSAGNEGDALFLFTHKYFSPLGYYKYFQRYGLFKKFGRRRFIFPFNNSRQEVKTTICRGKALYI